jgi:acyl carrier protein
VTEATVDSTWYESETAPSFDGMVPVGKPFAHNRLYVMDAQQRPLPVGVVGELCLGEPGLARGYRNRDDLTANVFVNDPCGTRLYRTGDLARWDADGNITLVGRMGNQVKIRGFRIELGEIEAAIVEIPAVHASVVLALEAGGIKRLVAYVEPQVGASINSNALRSALSQRLPEHMVPSLFIIMQKMPVTPNGKLDRRSLPAPREEDYTGGNFVAPRNPTEQGLADLWCEVLGLGKVGVLDSFFHVGGHSLLAVKLVTRVRDQFHIDLPLTTIFEQPTIEQLAMYIDSVAWTQQQHSDDNVNDTVAVSNDREEFEL